MRHWIKPIVMSCILGHSIAFAGTMGEQCTSDCPTHWAFSAQALYLKPSFGGNGLGYSAFSYGTDNFNNTVGAGRASNILTNVIPAWSWGFQLAGAYLFGAGNDLNLNWYHLYHKTRQHLPNGSLFAGNAPALYAGYIQVAPTWNAVNAEFGKSLVFDETKILRLHAGVEFAAVKTVFTNYPMLRANGSTLFITNDEISYNGFGPRLGADFTYVMRYGFGVYAKGAVSLLAGTAKQNVSGYQNLAFPQSFSTGNYVQSNNGVVIPELEAKLGVKYECDFSRGRLGFDVGYLWINYLNALVSQTGSGLAGSAVSTNNAANFNLNGLYFGLRWLV